MLVAVQGWPIKPVCLCLFKVLGGLFSAYGGRNVPNNGLFQLLRVCDTLVMDHPLHVMGCTDTIWEKRGFTGAILVQRLHGFFWVDQSPDWRMVGHLWLHYDDDPGHSQLLTLDSLLCRLSGNLGIIRKRQSTDYRNHVVSRSDASRQSLFQDKFS